MVGQTIFELQITAIMVWNFQLLLTFHLARFHDPDSYRQGDLTLIRMKIYWKIINMEELFRINIHLSIEFADSDLLDWHTVWTSRIPKTPPAALDLIYKKAGSFGPNSILIYIQGKNSISIGDVERVPTCRPLRLFIHKVSDSFSKERGFCSWFKCLN